MAGGRWLLLALLIGACTRPTSGGPAPTASAASSSEARPAATLAAPPARPTTSAAVAASGAPATSAPSSAPASADAPKADPGRLALEGKVVQGGLVRAKLRGNLRRMAFPGHRAIVSDDGAFLIAFGRDAPATDTLTITFDDGSVLEHVFQVEQRTYATDEVNGLSEDMIDLDGVTRVKLARFEDRIEAVRKGYGRTPCYKDGFTWPVKGKLTSHYGQKRVLNGVDGGIHWGVDIAATVGTDVHAPACGKVVFAEKDVPLSGTMVILDHGHGLTSAFLHLSRIGVKLGDELQQGAVLGAVGATGRTNGPHLDWRMNLFETRIDPELLAPALP